MTSLLSLTLAASILAQAPNRYEAQTSALLAKGMSELRAYTILEDLTSNVGSRLSGSPGDAKSVEWGKATMEKLGFQNVRLMPCRVHNWTRGEIETCVAKDPGGIEVKLTGTALGGSVGTPSTGITAEVIEVKSLAECEKLGDRAKGKIVFFNGPMPPEKLRTFEAYGIAVAQRSRGASTAAKVGAVAVLVRSVSTLNDDEPHTGAMGYAEGVTKIPAMALGVKSADRLSRLVKADPGTTVSMRLSCETRPDVPSNNVIGELVGSELPNEVIVIGGHLDSWDKGTGAHDDGAGVVHALDALRLIKELGWRPKRTIRAVLFSNEEMGGRGAAAYAAYAKGSKEKHIAAIESDAGGFAPRGYNCSLDANRIKRLNKWIPALSAFEAEKLTPNGGGGADIGPLRPVGTVLFGLEPESQRYFDYHHSHNDTIDKVNPRELQLGALSMAMLAWLISEEGI